MFFLESPNFLVLVFIAIADAEPNRLQEKHDDLIQQTQSLAYDNYQTFIQAADCSKEVYKDVSRIIKIILVISVNFCLQFVV